MKLNPKFAVLVRLDDEEIEQEIEVAIAKLRLELKRVKDKETLEGVIIDKEKKLSDLESNKRIKLDEKGIENERID